MLVYYIGGVSAGEIGLVRTATITRTLTGLFPFFLRPLIVVCLKGLVGLVRTATITSTLTGLFSFFFK